MSFHATLNKDPARFLLLHRRSSADSFSPPSEKLVHFKLSIRASSETCFVYIGIAFFPYSASVVSLACLYVSFNFMLATFILRFKINIFLKLFRQAKRLLLVRNYNVKERTFFRGNFFHLTSFFSARTRPFLDRGRSTAP